MPPKICTPWSATVQTISEAWRLTTEASSAVSVPWSSFHAPCSTSSSVARISICISASLNEIP